MYKRGTHSYFMTETADTGLRSITRFHTMHIHDGMLRSPPGIQPPKEVIFQYARKSIRPDTTTACTDTNSPGKHSHCRHRHNRPHDPGALGCRTSKPRTRRSQKRIWF